MKICIVTSSFPRFSGDFAGFFVQDQAVALSQRHEVHVIYPDNTNTAPNKGEPFVRHAISYPFRTYPLAQVHGFDLFNTPRLLASMIAEINSIRKRDRIDLFYAFWTIPSGFICSLVSNRTPVLTGIMGSDIKVFHRSALIKPFVRYAIRKADVLVAVSHDLKKEAIELGASENSIAVIPTGVDLNKFKPMDKVSLRAKLSLPQGPILLYSGSLFRLKRVDRLLEISSRLARELQFHVLLIGDGPERAKLETLARDLGLDNVIFKGKVSHNEVPLYTAASDFMVLLSETEGLPNCIEEAMSSGIPVIATNIGGIPDIISSGYNGYLVNSDEEAEKSIRLLLSSPALTQNLGSNALEFARSYLSAEEIYSQIISLCELTASGNLPKSNRLEPWEHQKINTVRLH